MDEFTEEHHEKARAVTERLTMGPSKIWIENFAVDLGISYEELMEAADLKFDTGEATNLGENENYNDHYDKFPEFWEHWSKITGKKTSNAFGNFFETSNFFSCSC